MNDTRLGTKSSGRDSVVDSDSVDDSAVIREKRAVRIRITVGDLIRLQRTNPEAPLTQEELADRSGVSYEHLNHIENYKAKVSIEVLDRIALALGFARLSDFLARDDKKIL